MATRPAAELAPGDRIEVRSYQGQVDGHAIPSMPSWTLIVEGVRPVAVWDSYRRRFDPRRDLVEITGIPARHEGRRRYAGRVGGPHVHEFVTTRGELFVVHAPRP